MNRRELLAGMSRLPFGLVGFPLAIVPARGVRAAVASGGLPDWFRANRVHAHTRLSFKKYGKAAIFLDAGRHFKAMGANVYVRHVKTGREGAWWPSAVGEVDRDIGGKNYAQAIIEDAHRAGCRIILYYRHMEDIGMKRSHPSWVTRDWNDRPVATKRGDILCMNSPYRQFVLDRLTELAHMGSDGFYFDEIHMPKTGCWCEYCRAEFSRHTGDSHPRRADRADPRWHELIAFNNLTIERAFDEWSRSLHAIRPEIVMLVGSHLWPTCSSRHTNHRLYRGADSVKTEIRVPTKEPRNNQLDFLRPDSVPEPDIEVKTALGLTLSRDAAGGRPAHVWVHKLPNEAAAAYVTAGVLTHGCIANIDIAEDSIGERPFREAFALGNRLSPHFEHARPLRWVALYFSEALRDRYLLSPDQAWPNVLTPLNAAYAAFFSAGVPCSILTDSQLELLDECAVLVTPFGEALPEPAQSEIARFEGRGGVRLGEGIDWVKVAAEGPEHDGVLKKILENAPVRALASPGPVHVGCYRQPERLNVFIANRFAWTVERGAKRKSDRGNLTEPPALSGVKCALNIPGMTGAVSDALGGRELAVERIGDAWQVRVPTFHHLAVVSVALE